MKKKLCILLAVAMLVSFAACGETSTSEYSQGLDKNGYFEGVTATDYVTLAEYKGITFPEDAVSCSEEMIDDTIESLKSSAVETNQITDRAVEEGDTVNIAYEGKIDGEAFDGGSSDGKDVTAGSDEFIDDMLDSLIGRMPGEIYDVNAVFPEDYTSEDLQGKEAVFTITINYISESYTPDFNDEYISEKFGEDYDIHTMQELRDYISTSYVYEYKMSYIESLLIDESEYADEFPQAVLDYEGRALVNYYTNLAAQYGMEFSTYASYTAGVETEEEFIEASSEDIAAMAKYSLAVQAIAENTGYKASNKDIADYFEEETGSRDYDDYKTAYGIPYLKQMVMMDYVVDYIIENAAN